MNETNLSAAPEQSAPAAAPEAAAPHEATEETVTVGALRGAIERRNAQRARSISWARRACSGRSAPDTQPSQRTTGPMCARRLPWP